MSNVGLWELLVVITVLLHVTYSLHNLFSVIMYISGKAGKKGRQTRDWEILVVIKVLLLVTYSQ